MTYNNSAVLTFVHMTLCACLCVCARARVRVTSALSLSAAGLKHVLCYSELWTGDGES